jgi:hypothetical protein
MSVYNKTCLFSKSLFQVAQITISEINRPAASGTDQVMVMLGRPSHH